MTLEYWLSQDGDSASGEDDASARQQAQLVEALKLRSTEAWDAFYRENYVPVRKFAFASLRSEIEAEDTAAITFHRALNAIDSYRFRGVPLAAWLFGIARNVVNERRRSLFREAQRTVRHQTPGSGLQTMEFPGAATDGDTLNFRLELLEALDELTSEQRDIFLLINVVGLSTREIADLLGKTERAIYYLRARALVRLREAMS